MKQFYIMQLGMMIFWDYQLHFIDKLGQYLNLQIYNSVSFNLNSLLSIFKLACDATGSQSIIASCFFLILIQFVCVVSYADHLEQVYLSSFDSYTSFCFVVVSSLRLFHKSNDLAPQINKYRQEDTPIISVTLLTPNLNHHSGSACWKQNNKINFCFAWPQRQQPCKILLEYQEINKVLAINKLSLRAMLSCKLRCLIAFRIAITLIFPLLLVLRAGICGEQVGTYVSIINNQRSKHTSDSTCQALCGENLFNEYGGSCCNTDKTTCMDKTTCLQNTIDTYERILDYSKKLLIIYCCSTVVAILLAVFLSKKFNQCQQDLLNQQRNNQFGNIVPTENDSNAIPALLAESFIAQERDAVCVVCYMEFEESRVVRLDCGHMYHRPCIQQWRKVSDKCPICGRHHT